MKGTKKYGLILCSVLLGLFACQKAIDVAANDNSEYKEYQDWLKTNGGIFSEEKIVLANQSNNKVSGELNWDQAKKMKNSNGDEIVVVPFNFTQSVYKNRKVYNDVSVNEMPSIYSLLIKKDKNGLHDGRLRIRSYNESTAKGKRIFNNWYKLTGEYSCAYLTENDGKNYTLYPVVGNARLNSANCEVTSTTSRYVDCSGGMNNTTCVYFSRTTNRYHCTFESGGMPEEVQEFQPGEGGGGWYEYEESETVHQNQQIIDSLQGYPCAQDILAQMPSCNDEVKKILDSVFNMNQDMNLTFKADASLTKDSLTNGYTSSATMNTSSFYEQSISLNAWVIQNSSKEFIATTMLHESIHAYIDFWYGRYLVGQIDSNTFKLKFPIFWDYKRALNGTELSQHNEMANNYVAMISRFVLQFNPGMSQGMADALSWKGLQFTTAWKNRSDTNQIKALYFIARRDTDTASYVNHNLTKCN